MLASECNHKKFLFKIVYCNKLTLGKHVTFRKGFTLWIDSAAKVHNDVVILKGVTIGENSVIGAGCIVKEDVPPNSVMQMYTSQKISMINYHA